jgi:hypothetical protein
MAEDMLTLKPKDVEKVHFENTNVDGENLKTIRILNQNTKLTLKILSAMLCIWMNSCTKKDSAPEVASIIASHYRAMLISGSTEYDSSVLLFDYLLSTLDSKKRKKIETNRNLIKIISGNPQLLKPNDPVVIVTSSDMVEFIIQKNGLVITRKQR